MMKISHRWRKEIMDYNPLVTIVIPVYNGTNFMHEAIDCALTQTYKNIEVLVVNDGSTDEGATDRIAKSYGDKIRYIYKENGGVSSVLNLAIQHMRGEWLSWLSHDDLYYPNKIEKQISFINKLIKEDENIDLNKIAIHTATESIDKDGKVIRVPSFKGVSEKENTIDVILNNIYTYRLSGCSFLLPANCFKDVGGFREDIRTVSDVEYWYRLLLAGYQFYCMKDDILVKNRSHGKQVGKTKIALFEKEQNNLFIEIADQLAKSDQFNSLKNFEKMYFGLVKRHLYQAADYVMDAYVKKDVSTILLYKISMKKIYWNALGAARNVLRNVYRRINVK